MADSWADTEFSSPELLSTWNPPQSAAVYMILMKSNPAKFEILYLGESGDLSDRGFETHHKRQCWINHAGTLDNVYIAVHIMAGSTSVQRREFESGFKKKFNPPCNED